MEGQLLIEIVFMHIRLIAKSYVGSPGAFFIKRGGGEFFATEPPSEGHTAYKCKKGGKALRAKLF